MKHTINIYDCGEQGYLYSVHREGYRGYFGNCVEFSYRRTKRAATRTALRILKRWERKIQALGFCVICGGSGEFNDMPCEQCSGSGTGLGRRA